MAIIIFESDNPEALVGFKAGLDFCNDGSLGIIDEGDDYLVIQDEDDQEEPRSYILDSETGFLSAKEE